MDNCVAVWANRSEILLGVYAEIGSDLQQRNSVVNVYESRCDRTVTLFQEQVAHAASKSEVGNARGTSLWIAFVRVQYNAPLCALGVTLVRGHFLWEDGISSASPTMP
jgi:hypothetical protein